MRDSVSARRRMGVVEMVLWMLMRRGVGRGRSRRAYKYWDQYVGKSGKFSGYIYCYKPRLQDTRTYSEPGGLPLSCGRPQGPRV